MATVLLQYAGAAVGGALGGPVGALVGRTLGAVAGSLTDQALFGRSIDGPRLDDLRVTASTEGAAIPAVFGRARVAGQLIWASPLEEVTRHKSAGGKGGPAVSEQSYYANLALGLAQGPIARITRAWADGKELALDPLTWRFYPGTEDQEPDSLILAREADCPAYRGLAYVVLERLPLAPYGNRIPQLSFEIERPLGELTTATRAMTIIPGSTEFGYDTQPIRRTTGPGRSESENAHASSVRTDWAVSLDQLQESCPRLENASLVIAWFGDSLDAANCRLRPGVDARDKSTTPDTWAVSGLTRTSARQVSQINGRAAFGGTPSDASVIRALRDLKARGLKATLYPFILMDMPGYPWRGHITTQDGPGVTAALASFIGDVAPGDFIITPGKVIYRGPEEWSLSRMVLHCAALGAAAGGVDAFFIASELPGLTHLRDRPGSYPAAALLAALARKVKQILPQAKLSYAADWAEYGAHAPADAPGDLGFPLDPLWADQAIDAIAIDNYMPLADWREGPDHADARAGHRSIHEPAYLSANVTAGEYFDWYYKTAADRAAQKRTPISDGLGKPWVWRAKDLVGWWSNPHLPRRAGKEDAPTAFVPQSKPIWFSELGCPAVDKGSNEPNRFPDAKSRDAGLPFASRGLRDDLMQRRHLEAMLAAFADPARNPRSPLYDGRMVDRARIYLWCWDARPFPWFPALDQVWSDGANYATGHWLNGRLGQPGLDDLITALLAHYGITAVDVSALAGTPVPGYVIDRPMSARDALEPLITAFAVTASESGAILRFSTAAAADARLLSSETFVETDPAKPLSEIRRTEGASLPVAMRIGFADLARDHRASTCEVRLPDAPAAGGQEQALSLAAVMDETQARALAAAALARAWRARDRLSLTCPPSLLALEPGDLITLPPDAQARPARSFRISALRGGLQRTLEADACEPGAEEDLSGPGGSLTANAMSPPPPAFALLLDLPLLPAAGAGPFVAAAADPWPGTLALYRRTGPAAFSRDGSITTPALMGLTTRPLAAGPRARRDRASTLEVEITTGTLTSISNAELLNGANLAAVGSMAEGFELIQFQTATMIAPRRWRLTGLLRAQFSSAPEMPAMRPAGAAFILIDQSLLTPDSAQSLQGRWTGEWRLGPETRDLGDASFVSLTLQSQARAHRPLAPCQLRCKRVTAGLLLSWRRQTRSGGDGWEQAEVPLAETAESYILIISDGTRSLREVTLSTPSFLYAAADMLADFAGVMPRRLTIRLRQISPEYGPGTLYEETCDV